MSLANTPDFSASSVSDALATRRSVRAFTPQPVPMDLLRDILEKAQRSPSGGNVQPWNAIVLAGQPLADMIAAVQARIAADPRDRDNEYDIYPKDLAEPYLSRRFGVGEAMYKALNVPREDKMGRLMQFARNFRAFDAPVLMLVHTPRYMGPPQWSDMGMWLQSIMLLLREAGLDSCAQEAWAVYASTIYQSVPIPTDNILFCGLAIGYRDPADPVNNFPVDRAPLGESVQFLTGQ